MKPPEGALTGYPLIPDLVIIVISKKDRTHVGQVMSHPLCFGLPSINQPMTNKKTLIKTQAANNTMRPFLGMVPGVREV